MATFFRASTLWTLYLRWNGAKIGRGVHINSWSISDRNMLEFGDGALSVVLKGSKREGSAIDAGIPARNVECKPNAKAVEEDDAAIGFF
ncbi:MAG: hypothetical protein EXQ51_13655 [Acidobacteria bacterium]|nr:hypothetical protein [Acidobacteriota bacterium]